MSPHLSRLAWFLVPGLLLAACGGDGADQLPPARELFSGPTLGGVARYSPDGSTIAFVNTIQGESAVMVMPADGSAPPTRLTHGVWDANPVWSPDGGWIAYNSEATNGVWVVPAEGGEARALSPGLPSFDIPLSWLPDGSGVVYQQTGGAVQRTMVAPLDGSSVRPLLPGERGSHAAGLSPDGRQVAVMRLSGGRSTLWVGGFPDGELRPLTTEGSEAVGQGAWSPDGRRILFESRRTGTLDLWIAELETGELRQLTTDVRDDTQGRWSPDGQWIAFRSNRGGQWDTWVVPAEGGDAVRVTADAQMENMAEWSPSGTGLAYTSSLATTRIMELSLEDGTSRGLLEWAGHTISDLQPSPDGATIAFVSNRSGNQGVWTIATAGGDPRPVAVGGANEWQPRWSPDGRHLAFASSRTGQNSVWITADTGGSQRRLVDWDDHHDEHAWSPDGSRIALHSGRDADGFDLWVVAVDGGAATRLTTGLNVTRLLWSPDGAAVYFVASEPAGGSRLYRIPSSGGTPIALGTAAQTDGHVLSPDGGHVAFMTIAGGWSFIDVIPTAGGETRRLTTEQEQVFHAQPVWSPDGSHLVVNVFDFEATGSNLALVAWPSGEWRPLTNRAGNNFGATWLADGRRIVHLHGTREASLRVIDVSGLLGGR